MWRETRCSLPRTTASTGSRLWTSDGTLAGTRLFADIAPGDGSSVPNAFFLWDQTLYFRADDLVHGFELWRMAPVTVSDTRPRW